MTSNRPLLIVLLVLSTSAWAQEEPGTLKAKPGEAAKDTPKEDEPFFGYIDKTGKWVIGPKFEDAEPFRDGVAVVEAKEGYGVIDSKGKWLVKPQFDRAGEWGDGLVYVEDDDADKAVRGFIDRTGRLVIDVSEIETGWEPQFKEGRLKVGIEVGTRPKTGIWGETDGVEPIYKYGFIDKTGRRVVPSIYEYDQVDESFSEGLAAVQVGEKWGYIDTSGKMVIEPQFDHAEPFGEGVAYVESPSRLIDRQGRTVVKLGRVLPHAPFREGLAPTRRLDRFGFMDKTGNPVIPPRFGVAHDFHEGLAAVYVRHGYHTERDGRWGYVDREGRVVIPPRFKEAGDFSEGLAVVRSYASGLEGLIDKTGAWVIPPHLVVAGEFSQGMAAVLEVKRDEPADSMLRGYIDRDGKVVIPPRFKQAGPFKDGVAVVVEEDRFGLIDRKGNWLGEARYDMAATSSEGLVRVATVEGDAFLDTTGKTVIEPGKGFIVARDMHDGVAAVQDARGKWGYIDRTGKWLAKPQFDEAEDFSDGVGLVHLGKQKGFLGKEGWVVPLGKFEDLHGFSEGLGWVRQDGLWGCIDPNGKMVIEPGFQYPAHFHEGMALMATMPFQFIDKTGKMVIDTEEMTDVPIVRAEFNEGLCPAWHRKTGFINKKGELVIPHLYYCATAFSEGLAAVSTKEDWVGGWGYVDPQGKMVIEPAWDFCWPFKEGRAVVVTHTPDGKGRCGFIDKTGKVVVPVKYDRAEPFSEGLAVVGVRK